MSLTSPTVGEMITEIAAELHGWGGTSDRVSPLATSMSTSDLNFTVDATTGPALGISPGEVEIDSELIYVQSIDQNSNVATVASAGRGYRGTAKAAHNPGVMVISRPRFPRYYILKTLNEVLGAVFPDLFAVNTWTGQVTYPSNTYTLPKTPLFVIDAQWQDPVGNWQRAQSVMVDPFDGALRLGSGPWIGRPLRVVYATEPTLFTSESDNFQTVTGLPQSCADVLMLGAISRFVVAQDLARAQITSVEQSDRARLVPPGTAENAAKWLTAIFQQRLSNEAQSLRKRYRPRLTKVW